MLFHRAAQRHRDRAQADAIEAVASGYSSVKTDKGLKNLQSLLKMLRGE